jgi:anti-sigma B factor antagonist
VRIVESRTLGGSVVVGLEGDLDISTVQDLRDCVTRLVAAGSVDVVMDLRGLEFMDSSGIGVLVGSLKSLRAHGGSMRVVCTQRRLLRVFKLTGLTSVFDIHASVEEATVGAAPAENGTRPELAAD